MNSVGKAPRLNSCRNAEIGMNSVGMNSVLDAEIGMNSVGMKKIGMNSVFTTATAQALQKKTEASARELARQQQALAQRTQDLQDSAKGGGKKGGGKKGGGKKGNANQANQQDWWGGAWGKPGSAKRQKKRDGW